jgi:YtoQ family protein
MPGLPAAWSGGNVAGNRRPTLYPGTRMQPIVVYLAGEIHSDWRERLRRRTAEMNLPVEFVGPQEAHDRSDSVGEDITGEQPTPRFRDLVGAGANTLRTRVLLRRADLVVAYFGDKYRQWNTAADAGAAVASGLPLLLVRAPELTHALKELDAMASFTVETLDQAAEAIAYVFE